MSECTGNHHFPQHGCGNRPAGFRLSNQVQIMGSFYIGCGGMGVLCRDTFVLKLFASFRNSASHGSTTLFLRLSVFVSCYVSLCRWSALSKRVFFRRLSVEHCRMAILNQCYFECKTSMNG